MTATQIDDGFDPTEWDPRDTANTVRHLATLIDEWFRDLEVPAATALRAELTDATDAFLARLDEASHGDLEENAAALHRRLIATDEHVEGTAELLGRFWPGLRRAAGARDAARTTPLGTGRLDRINVSDGGVPKSAVDSAEVGRRGVLGDRQAARQHHGRPWQALCLWSSEVIDELAGLGHPIAAGSAGENLTIGGLDWGALRGGEVLRIGSMTAQLSHPAVPCAKNAPWFSDGAFGRIHHDENRRWTRWYATVLTTGAIATGDVVEHLPATPVPMTAAD